MNLPALIEARQKKGYTQAYMAERLGFTTRSSYCLIEKGKVAMSVPVAVQIADILEMQPSQILSIFFDKEIELRWR